MPANSAAAALRGAIRAEAPQRPGVYTFRGSDGRPLYVGKSVNLQARMLSYLAPGQTARDSRIRHLAHAIRGFEYRETQSELLALLLEDALIKQLDPPANTRQRDYRERVYLLLTDDPFPALRVVDGLGPNGGELYGPVKDRFFAGRLVELLRDRFRLRHCTDPVPHRRSSAFDLGLCRGPCRGVVTESAYGEGVDRARRFLGGEGTWLEAQISNEMAERAARYEFEAAAALRETLDFVCRFKRRQRFASRFLEKLLEVRDAGGGGRGPWSFRFRRGELESIESPDGGPTLSIPPELGEPVTDSRWMLDRAEIVFHWLGRTALTGTRDHSRAPALRPEVV